MDDKMFWMAIRQALLMVVDAIERRFDLRRTAEARREVRKCGTMGAED